MLGIEIYEGKSKQCFSQGSIRTQHKLATSVSQMCMGAKPPYPMESTTVIRVTASTIRLVIITNFPKVVEHITVAVVQLLFCALCMILAKF